MKYTFLFTKSDKKYWIEMINSICGGMIEDNNGKGKETIQIILSDNIDFSNVSPVHIVLLACLFEHINKRNYDIYVELSDDRLANLLFKDLKTPVIFNNLNDKPHIEAESDSILNLWRVVDSHAYTYSLSVTGYFRRRYFEGFDLSALSTSLDEIYANIADHSASNGTAFSYIDYDINKRIIRVAACDLGVGIPCTLKKAGYLYNSDEEALIHSLNTGITAKTKPHNKGYGLNNIASNLSDGDMLRIISNEALLFYHRGRTNIKTYPLGFNFKGTLIYFEISIDSFSEEEIFSNISIG